MRRRSGFWVWCAVGVLAFPALAWAQPANFATSLHGTRDGKDLWYSGENGGFEALTGIPIEQVGCKKCHGPTDAAGNAYGEDYTPSCVDCHNVNDNFSVSQDQCYSCHGRQKTEAVALGLPDVHRDAGMVCWDCHSSGDVHGDGTAYASMMEPGAIDADCENCHGQGGMPLPANHDNYDPHQGKLHCTACHAQTVVSCYNCHFESVVEAHQKRPKQPILGFVLLVNREKDGKVHPASFQSLTYEGNAFVAIGPYTPHSIMPQGRTCSDCHNQNGSNAAITEYNETGQIHFARWDDEQKTLTVLQGVVPIPADYEQTFRLDFITYDGDPHDPVGPSNNWSSIGKDTWDAHQMLFCSPLTAEQMEKLGFVVPQQPFGVDLTINGNDDLDILTPADNVSVDVTVTAGDQDGVAADWWIVASTVWGWYYWDPFTGDWFPGFYPSLVDFPILDVDNFNLYNGTLPAGYYNFWFAVFPDGGDMAIDVVPLYVTQ